MSDNNEISSLTIPELKQVYDNLRTNLNKSAKGQVNGLTILERLLIKKTFATGIMENKKGESEILRGFVLDATATNKEEENILSPEAAEKLSLPNLFTQVQ